MQHVSNQSRSIAQQRRLRLRRFSREAGATLVEAALVLPLLLLTILAFFDLAKVFFLQSVFNSAAKSGLNLALKVPNIESTDETLFQPALSTVVEGAKAARSLGLVGAESGMFNVKEIRLVRPAAAASAAHEIHPLAACRNAPTGMTPAEMYFSCPLGVRVVAGVKMIVPFINDIQLVGEAFGFRESAIIRNTLPEIRR